MYLKQLTLRGFKSFASATTLDFEPGITCVVGPNGSGKSNVVDALSWVMGEQGAKTLRGGKMEDVIFAGTTKRAPLGRAEVELTIDNSDGALPIEYTEVTISRTMFRSGGSEYAINGSPSRLLDVQELLSDSGIGREMHVVVGQGQLDAILHATPESRRGFIEEAAGVLKHRRRKEKALRKLDGTKANVERLTDLLGELQRQLKPLGRQAETARKAAVIQAELRDAKARLLADDLTGAKKALEEELADEAAVKEARARAEADVGDCVAAEEASEAALKAAGRAFDSAQENWYALAGLRERLSATLSVAAERMRMRDAQPSLEVTARDPEELEREAAKVRETESELAGKAEAAHTALTDATLRRNTAEQEHSTAEQAYATSLRAVADRREGLARLGGQLSSQESRLEALTEEIERLEHRLTETEERAEQAVRSYHETEASLPGLGANESDLDHRYEAAAKQVEELETRLGELQEQESDLKREKAALEARLEALAMTGESKDGSQDLLALDRDGIVGRLSALIEIEPGWENAVAAALGDAADGVVARDLETAVWAVEYLAGQDLGRAPLLVEGASGMRFEHEHALIHKIRAAERTRETLEVLLAGFIGAKTLSQARSAVEQSSHLTAVTKAGDLISARLVEGGSKLAGTALELSAKIAEAETALTRCGHELDQRRFAAAEVTAKLDDASQAEAEALELLHASDAELAAIADRLGGLKQTQAAAAKEAGRLKDAINTATEARLEAGKKLAEFQMRLDAASDDEPEEPDPTRRDEAAKAARQARQEEMDARLALRTIEEQAKALAGRAEGLRRAAAAERQSRARAKARAEQLAREADVAQSVHDAASQIAHRVERAHAEATRQRDISDEQRREAEAAVVTARGATREATRRLDELVRGEHKDEMVRIEHRMRIEQLTDRALSELGLDDETLINDYGPHLRVPVITRPDGSALTDEDEVPEPVAYDRDDQTKRLRRAERNLSVLGRINPLALEEFEAMKTRHAFLAEQLEDLKRTREDLLDLIEKVDARVQEVFTAAYRDVEETFSSVFSRLFPGGEGKLVLTEPDDWLTTGVDVEARPAGKQVKRLSLLSGGERSLVAVAFLVSLFIARPSPFYILDEVEAALDDANLGRLLAIYEELRLSSQLIVITHQKRTMEIADSLYGVSMRGDGISTVVSQRITES